MAEPDLARDPTSTGEGPEGRRRSDPAPVSAALLSRLNRHGFRLLMLVDMAVLAAIAVGSMIWRYGLSWPTYPAVTYAVSFVAIVSLFMASLYFGGLYEREPRLGAPPVLPRVTRQTLAAGGLVALLRLGTPGIGRQFGLDPAVALAIPVPNLVTLIVLGAAGVATNRWLAHRLRTRREGPPKIVLAGTVADLEVARTQLDVDRRSAVVVAEVVRASDLLETVRATHATDVVLVSSGWVDDLYPTEVRAFDREGVAVLLRVTARETLYGLVRIREVGGLPFVLLRAQTMPKSRAHFKRFFDLMILALTAPAWLLVLGLSAVYQLVAAGRPLLFRQTRIGAGEQPFEMVKFRTMVVNAEEDGRGARLAATRDPRILPSCRWIRATRMDELPQLWNVLRGEMSLVGPRPERPELTVGFEQRIAGYARRHELPPGLTGLAQIHGRYHTDPEYKLGYDLQYLVNWSPVLDLEILFRTVWVVLARRI